MANHYHKQIETPKLNAHFNTIMSSKLKKRLHDYNENNKPKIVNKVEKEHRVKV
jgi:hypothetical protein